MSNNMVFIYNGGAGTYTLSSNPSTFKEKIVNLDDNARTKGGALINYHNASYRLFELSWDNMGTADFTNLKTIFDTHADVDFYPYDEVRGTALHYTCRMMNDFDFAFVDSFWTSGFIGQIILEQT